jgi:hypothetical protein
VDFHHLLLAGFSGAPTIRVRIPSRLSRYNRPMSRGSRAQ